MAVPRDIPVSGALAPACAPNGVRQPKWCLCFRMDRLPTRDRTTSELAWKHQRDFFITVIDPPSGVMCQYPVPFFASDVACQIANIIVSRPCLEHLQGQSFERKVVAAVGTQCVTAGFVAAMLGAKVVFLSERRYFQNVQQNIKLYLKDSLDYTKMKSANVTAVCAEKAKNFEAESLCDALDAPPPLDIVIISESGAEACCRMSADVNWLEPPARLFRLLEELVPPQAATKVLLICDGSLSFNETVGFHAEDSISALPQDTRLPIEAELPLTWHMKPFCTMLQYFPVVWLERIDAEAVRRQKPLTPFRRYLPPMGAASARCGCGGHPQKNFLNHRVMNFDWQENHQRLKESLVHHNRWKYTENAKELEKAKAWAATGCRMVVNRDLLEKESSTLSDVGTVYSLDQTNSISALMSTNDQIEPRDCLQDSSEEVTNGDAPSKSCIGNEGSLTLDSSEGMSATRRPQLSPPKAPRKGRGNKGYIGRLAAKVAKTSTITERHAQPPHWYRCNRVPY